jgi:NAD(P)H dehydrogenase (quinone)
VRAGATLKPLPYELAYAYSGANATLEREKQMKLGVTGANGQLGRLVVQGLLERCEAADIVAIVRDPGKAADLAALGVEVRPADYDDRASLDAAVADLDKVLLISSSEVGRRFPQHKNVIDAAKGAGVKQLVYTSAPKATTSALILAPEHKATEEYLAASGLPYVVLRNNWYTENYVQSVRSAKATGVLVAAAGDGRVASASRADYAEGAAVVLSGEGHEGKVYEFSGDRAWDYNELAAAIAEVTGTECSYKSVAPPELVAAMTAAGLDEGTAGFVATLDANIAEGALGYASPDLSALIGRPTTPLKETVKKLAE